MDADEFEEFFSQKQLFENVKEDGEMSPRERFFAIMDYQKPDRIIDREFGYWKDTLRRWHSEGLPEYVDSNAKADVFFGFDDWTKNLGTNVNLQPAFPTEIISDDGEHQIIYDSHHVKCEVFTDGHDTIPHYLDFPIKDKKSYREHKKRLQPDNLEERIHFDIKEVAKQVKDRNYALCASGGSTAGMVRNWMGFENICLALFDQPALLDEILEDLCRVSVAVAEAVTKYIDVDMVFWWEDIAYKTGPIVTPDFFINKCGPVIKKVMDVYRANGTRFGMVDCDGDFSKLLPGWMNNGVNIMFPLEVASGIHPEKLRNENERILMSGGVDKVVLTNSKFDIKKELLKLQPIVEEGGFIPHVDHRVQADVTYDNYLYYLEVKRDLFQLPGKIIEDTAVAAI